MENKIEHTPTPDIINNFLTGSTYGAFEDARIREYIRRAVNSHEELLKALKVQNRNSMRDGTPCNCPAGEEEWKPLGKMPTDHSTKCEMMRKAIAQAEG